VSIDIVAGSIRRGGLSPLLKEKILVSLLAGIFYFK